MDRTAVHNRISCRWRRPDPELIPAVFAPNNSFSPQYQRFRPSARSSTQLRAVWSQSSASSDLFGLPIEILERVLFFLSPDLTSFALVNSDCQYLARPLQFRCTKVRLFVDDVNTPFRQDHGALECLLLATQQTGSPLGLAIAPYVRYLQLHGAGVRCDANDALDNQGFEVFEVQPSLVSLIPTLTNLEAISHRMLDEDALLLTAPYMLALMKSSIKHIALRGILCSPDEVYKLQREANLPWPVETLIIKAHWAAFHGHPDTKVPSILMTSCFKTLRRLTLDSSNAIDLFTESGNHFPALHTVHLDPTLGRDPSPTSVIRGHPVLSALHSTIACRVESIPTLRRYTCSIRFGNEDAEILVDNLKRNSQLESFSITADQDICFQEIYLTILINTLCQMPKLRALSPDGEMSEGFCVEALQSIASMSMLQNLQLWGPVSWLELFQCMQSGCMQSLEWLSVGTDIDYGHATDSFSMPYPTPPLPAEASRRIDMYRTLFEAELFASVLPALRGCILGAMPVQITNGRARALMSRNCTEEEVNQLWDHSLTSTPTHLWHWD